MSFISGSIGPVLNDNYVSYTRFNQYVNRSGGSVYLFTDPSWVPSAPVNVFPTKSDFVAGASATLGDLYLIDSNSDLYGYGTLPPFGATYSNLTQIGAKSWKDVTTNGDYTIALANDGTLWGVGNNINGQLGINSVTNSSILVQIGTDVDWTSISCGYGNTACIKNDGTLWTWGNNNHGQLGTGDTTNRLVPTHVYTNKTFKSVSTSSATFAIASDNTLWATGYINNNPLIQSNSFYEFDFNSWDFINSNPYTTCGIRSDSSLWFIANTQSLDSMMQSQNTGSTNWSEVIGDYTSAAIKGDGTLWYSKNGGNYAMVSSSIFFIRLLVSNNVTNSNTPFYVLGK